MNGYFPQGESIHHETKFPKKIKYYADLKKHILQIYKKTNRKILIMMGDFNVAPEDIDIGILPENMNRWLRVW